MSVDFRFIAVDPAVRLIFGTLQIGLYGSGRPALVYFDENGMPVLHATANITHLALPRDALIIRGDGPATGFLQQMMQSGHVLDLGEDVYDAHGVGGRLVLPVGTLSEAINQALCSAAGAGAPDAIPGGDLGLDAAA